MYLLALQSPRLTILSAAIFATLVHRGPPFWAQLDMSPTRARPIAQRTKYSGLFPFG